MFLKLEPASDNVNTLDTGTIPDFGNSFNSFISSTQSMMQMHNFTPTVRKSLKEQANFYFDRNQLCKWNNTQKSKCWFIC